MVVPKVGDTWNRCTLLRYSQQCACIAVVLPILACPVTSRAGLPGGTKTHAHLGHLIPQILQLSLISDKICFLPYLLPGVGKPYPTRINQRPRCCPSSSLLTAITYNSGIRLLAVYQLILHGRERHVFASLVLD